MGIAVLSRPISGASNWNAAGNPISYKFTRTDSGYTQINNAGGFLQIQINGVDLTAYYQVTNHVFIGAPLGVYSMGLITASAFSGGNTLITLDQTYTASIPAASPLVNNSKRTDYKLYVEVFKASDNTSLTSGVRSTYSPLQTSLVYANISAVVKTFLSADWTDPSAVNEVETGTSLKVYIKWQEYYDGALQGGVTSDSANPIHAVFSAMQVGSVNGGNMLAYIPDDSPVGKFLQKFQPSTDFKKMVMWRSWPFTVSFIFPDVTADAYSRHARQYDIAGTLLSDLTTSMVQNNGYVNRLDMPSLDSTAARLKVELVTISASFSAVTVTNNSFVATISPWSSVSHGISVADPWTWEAGDWVQCVVGDGSNFQSQYLESPTHAQIDSGLPVRITTVVLTDSADPSLLFVTQLWNGSAWVAGGGPGDIAVSGADQNIVIQFNAPFNFTKFRLLVSASATSYDYKIKAVTLEKGTLVPVTEELDIEIKDACDYVSEWDGVLIEKNPIHLEWKNSSGGDSFWNFGKYHEYQYTYSNGRKAKRIQLFETQIHPVQWEALQDLNGIGEVFQNSIPELTSSIVKTSTKRGQQVYIVNKAGTKKTGVIVINTSDSGFAKDNVNIFSVTIELPEVFGLE